MKKSKILFSVLLVCLVVLLQYASVFSMSRVPAPVIISIIEHTGVVKITKPYGGTITIGPEDRPPDFIPVGSRIEVISGNARVIIGEDTVTIESGEVVYIRGDELTGAIDFTIIPLEPESLVEPLDIIQEEASPSAP